MTDGHYGTHADGHGAETMHHDDWNRPHGHCFIHDDIPCPDFEVVEQDLQVDVAWIAKQMRDEADALTEPPTCAYCGKLGPGLFWLPSEVGVIEMAIWVCSPYMGSCVRS